MKLFGNYMCSSKLYYSYTPDAFSKLLKNSVNNLVFVSLTILYESPDYLVSTVIL